MTTRRIAILCVPLALAVACGGEDVEPAASPDAGLEPTPISGMYRVSGVTLDTATGSQRDISGTVILSQDGGEYTATYDLSTMFPGEEGSHAAEVIGMGSGTVEGRTLRGEAQTQVVIASVPGVDPGFAFLPRTTTARIVSKSVTTIAADGSVQIEIENSGASGERYSPTRTVLRGMRVSAAGIGGDLEPSGDAFDTGGVSTTETD